MLGVGDELQCSNLFFSVRVRVLAMNENLKPVTEGHVTIDIVVCYSIGHMALMFCTCVFIFA